MQLSKQESSLARESPPEAQPQVARTSSAASLSPTPSLPKPTGEVKPDCTSAAAQSPTPSLPKSKDEEVKPDCPPTAKLSPTAPAKHPDGVKPGYDEELQRVWDGNNWSIGWKEGERTDAAVAVFADGSEITVPHVLVGDLLEKGVALRAKPSYCPGSANTASKSKKESFWTGEHPTLGTLQVLTGLDSEKNHFARLMTKKAPPKQIIQVSNRSVNGNLELGKTICKEVGLKMIETKTGMEDKKTLYAWRDEIKDTMEKNVPKAAEANASGSSEHHNKSKHGKEVDASGVSEKNNKSKTGEKLDVTGKDEEKTESDKNSKGKEEVDKKNMKAGQGKIEKGSSGSKTPNTAGKASSVKDTSAKDTKKKEKSSKATGKKQSRETKRKKVRRKKDTKKGRKQARARRADKQKERKRKTSEEARGNH